MLEINLRRHRGKFCAVWYDEAGRRQRRSLGTTDRALANTRLTVLKTQLTQAVPAGVLTVGAIFSRYIEDREAEGKPTTRIRDAWKRLGPHYADLRPVDITKAVTRDYIAKRGKDGVGNGTIHTELAYLRAALEFAVKERWITQASYIPVPQKPSPKEHHLTKPEAQRLLDAAVMPHVQLFIRLALATAGRMSAILELTWDRVDLDARRINLRDPDRPVTRKGRAVVPINDWLLPALQKAKEAALSPYVVEWGGSRVLSVKKGIAASAKRAGVKCSPHVLRHSAAVWMAEDGVPVEEIGQYLGHEDVRTTYRIYARFSPDHLQHAAKTLAL